MRYLRLGAAHKPFSEAPNTIWQLHAREAHVNDQLVRRFVIETSKAG